MEKEEARSLRNYLVINHRNEIIYISLNLLQIFLKLENLTDAKYYSYFSNVFVPFTRNKLLFE